MSSIPTFKLGRHHRSYDSRIPHYSALVAGQPPVVLPQTVDYITPLPANLGMMLNDNLGDCTCAAFYHALQVWSVNAGFPIDTEVDADVKKLYELACGYNPLIPGEGPGGNEQSVLTYLLNVGAPVGKWQLGPLVEPGTKRNKIAAFVEVDPRNANDIKRAILECGGVYIGFTVPASLMGNGAPAPVWDYDPNNAAPQGGHAVFVAGYDDTGLKLISWGQVYKMTWAFWNAFVDEAYAIADYKWINAKGTTPAGWSLEALIDQMQSLKAAA